MKELVELRDTSSLRTTLKLKSPSGTRSLRPAAASKIRGAAKAADWADEHKQRMQADMDLLGFGHLPTDKGRGR